MDIEKNSYIEKQAKTINGWVILPIIILGIILGIGIIVISALEIVPSFCVVFGVLLIFCSMILTSGFKLIAPNEAIVLVLFGKYYGTIKKEGFYWVNIFATKFTPIGEKETTTVKIPNKKISLKAMTLNNEKQKVNDLDGNPIEIGVVVIWKIEDTAKAVFNVDNYNDFISIQSDATIRNIARQYPYDIDDKGDEKSLRGSSKEIADMLCAELQSRVDIAGIKIVEARISHLAYSQEIAAAMLQRQQAKAVVDARTKIVEGAVGMVELALEKLDSKNIVKLNDSQKAQMVANLMVVLCSNKDTQPVVNSGSGN